jgi:hypothetical protein
MVPNITNIQAEVVRKGALDPQAPVLDVWSSELRINTYDAAWGARAQNPIAAGGSGGRRIQRGI